MTIERGHLPPSFVIFLPHHHTTTTITTRPVVFQLKAPNNNKARIILSRSGLAQSMANSSRP
jgi:hypothetical protein